MALLWADGFGHYGTSARFVSSGFYVYTTNDSSEPLQIGSGANARTGSYYWDASNQVFTNWYGGRMIFGGRDTLGVGAAFLFNTVPNGGYNCFMFVADNKDNFQCSLRPNADGSLSAISGKDGAEYGRTSAGLIVAGAYPYIEMKVHSHATAGTIEVHINNIPRLILTGLNTAPAGNTHLDGIMCGRNGGGANGTYCQAIADFVIWDTTGTLNNDFLGDRRCYTFFGTADGPTQDWTPTGGGSAFSQIDNVPYDAAQNISATTIGDVSNFDHAAMATNVSQVAGLNIFVTGNKTDAGTCEITPQVVSSGDVGSGTPIVPGTGLAVYNSIIEADPHTGTYFTKATFDPALLQIERTG